jgi:hypothetical protein
MRSLLANRYHEGRYSDIHSSSDSTAVDIARSSPKFDQPLFAFDAAEVSTSPSTLVSAGSYNDSGASDLKPRFYGEVTLETCAGHSHFKPFTTRGPASTISRPFTPLPIIRTRFDTSIFPSPGPQELDCEGAINLDNKVTSGLPTVEDGPRDLDEGPNVHLSRFPEAQPSSPSLCGAGYGHVAFEEQYSPSPKYLDLSPAPSLSDPRPIYFDSPVEDCLSSDLPSEPFVLDVDELDFQWTRFDRGGTCQESAIGAMSSARDVQQNVGADLVQQEFPNIPSPDESLFHFQTVLNTTQPTSPLLQVENACKAFAPVPNIYLSPLKKSLSESDNVNAHGSSGASQCSQDSIKSWSY